MIVSSNRSFEPCGFTQVQHCLTQASFRITYDSTKRIFDIVLQKGIIPDHCLNTLLQLAQLFHGLEFVSNLYRSYLGLTKYHFKENISDKSGYLIVSNLFFDYAKMRTIEALDLKKIDTFQEEVSQKIAHKLDKIASQFESKASQELKEMRTFKEGMVDADRLDAFEEKLFKTISEIHIYSLEKLKSCILVNEKELTAKKAYAYYFLFKFPKKSGSTRFNCHAFTLLQSKRGNKSCYYLLQSWLHSYSVLDLNGKKSLKAKDVVLLFDNMMEIIREQRWGHHCDTLWRKWFSDAPYRVNENKRNFKLEYIEGKNGNFFSPAAIAINCSSCKFNPQKIENVIQGNYEHMLSLANKA